MGHRGGECLFWVGSSSWQDGEAAVRRRPTLERQVTNTLRPDYAIRPPVAEVEDRSSVEVATRGGLSCAFRALTFCTALSW
uniref:Uncharacterized protein n=1 Tax=Thauera sp. B4 TaxID=503999 RepID=B4Y362_9RHOO|nr:hypothetical protein [Thauera sp. B4]